MKLLIVVLVLYNLASFLLFYILYQLGVKIAYFVLILIASAVKCHATDLTVAMGTFKS